MSGSTKRQNNNGALAFHQGTEDRLAEYVQLNAIQNDIESVIKTVDAFCWQNHWMMHVGDVKGEIVDNAIRKTEPTTILELGSYCGYSAIRMAKFLPPNGKLYTIDPFPRKAAQILIDKAGLSDKIVCIHGYAKDVIPTLDQLKNQVDLVFIDHEKSAYLPDLQLIEKYNLMHRDSVVVADNVLIFNINDYLHHVRNSGLYASENFVARLEYNDSDEERFIDGVEVSKYIV